MRMYFRGRIQGKFKGAGRKGKIWDSETGCVFHCDPLLD